MHSQINILIICLYLCKPALSQGIDYYDLVKNAEKFAHIYREEAMNNEGVTTEISTADKMNLPSNSTSIRENIVDTFSCENRSYGYYADTDNDCQVFHVCYPVQMYNKSRMYKWSFICPGESQFNQEVLVCARSVNSIPCEDSPYFYYKNEEFGKVDNTTAENDNNLEQPNENNSEYRKNTVRKSNPVTNLMFKPLWRDMRSNVDEPAADIYTVGKTENYSLGSKETTDQKSQRIQNKDYPKTDENINVNDIKESELAREELDINEFVENRKNKKAKKSIKTDSKLKKRHTIENKHPDVSIKGFQENTRISNNNPRSRRVIVRGRKINRTVKINDEKFNNTNENTFQSNEVLKEKVSNVKNGEILARDIIFGDKIVKTKNETSSRVKRELLEETKANKKPKILPGNIIIKTQNNRTTVLETARNAKMLKEQIRVIEKPMGNYRTETLIKNDEDGTRIYRNTETLPGILAERTNLHINSNQGNIRIENNLKEQMRNPKLIPGVIMASKKLKITNEKVTSRSGAIVNDGIRSTRNAKNIPGVLVQQKRRKIKTESETNRERFIKLTKSHNDNIAARSFNKNYQHKYKKLKENTNSRKSYTRFSSLISN